MRQADLLCQFGHRFNTVFFWREFTLATALAGYAFAGVLSILAVCFIQIYPFKTFQKKEDHPTGPRFLNHPRNALSGLLRDT